jgi:hypothetical protein
VIAEHAGRLHLRNQLHALGLVWCPGL